MTRTSNGSTGSGPVVDQVMTMMERSQKAMTDATSGMAEMWGAALSGADEAARRPGTTMPTSLPSMGEFVDRWADTGIAVIEMQRSVAHQMLDAMRMR